MTASEKTEANKGIVMALLRGAFVERDPTVFDRLLSRDYQQHNPLIPNGPDAIKAVAGNLPQALRYDPGMVVAEADYVMVHGRYAGWGPKPMVAVDIFRVSEPFTWLQTRTRKRPQPASMLGYGQIRGPKFGLGVRRGRSALPNST